MQTTLINEQVYYGDGAVWVTGQRFVVGERTYWLDDIDSVEVGKVPGEQWTDLRSGSFDWSWLLIPTMPILVMLKTGPDPVPIILAALITTLVWVFAHSRSNKPSEPVLQAVPVYVIKLKGDRLRHVVFASLDEDHTERLADLIVEAAQAQRDKRPPGSVTPKVQVEPPRGNLAFPALDTYFIDGLVCVTSEVVHVGRESYPLRGVQAVYVHVGRIDWYTPNAIEGYFVILNIHGTLTPVLATTDLDYAYKVTDAIRDVLKELSHGNLSKAHQSTR
ncbi:MAG TPA: DUF6232 family protein [Chloroflexia bacterium]|jgi:hypothetical protein